MVDKYALADDLTKGFINYQYNLDNPMSFPSEKELIQTYQLDHIFHRKIDSMVSGVMMILDKHI